MATTTTTKQRRTSRKLSDSSVVRLQIKDRMGNPRWVTADLLDTSEHGIGICIVAPLAVGMQVVARGSFGPDSA